MKLFNTLRLLAIPVALLFATAANAQLGTSVTQSVSNVTIWPVPFTTSLTVKVPGLVTQSMSIQLINDRQVVMANYTGPFDNQYSMAVAAVPSGTYTLIIQDRGQVIVRKRVTKL